MTDYSGNEIETMVLKAARGGGLPLGLAEDLAAAAAYLDLGALTRCPCDSGAAQEVPAALDRVLAGQGAQHVAAEAALVAAYIRAVERQTGRQLDWAPTDTGAVIKGVTDDPVDAAAPLGRRAVSDDLAAHLLDLVARTYVPDTDASRAAGAGAGLDDND